MMPIKCYLCNGDAQYKDIPEGRCVLCPDCTYYYVTRGALKFYLKRETEPLLDAADIGKLIMYVQDNYDEEEGVAVKLEMETIGSVTGKKSIHYRWPMLRF